MACTLPEIESIFAELSVQVPKGSLLRQAILTFQDTQTSIAQKEQKLTEILADTLEKRQVFLKGSGLSAKELQKYEITLPDIRLTPEDISRAIRHTKTPAQNILTGNTVGIGMGTLAGDTANQLKLLKDKLTAAKKAKDTVLVSELEEEIATYPTLTNLIKAGSRKLNAFFSRSFTLKEYFQTSEGKTLKKTFNQADNNAFEVLQFFSDKTHAAISGENPLLSYMKRGGDFNRAITEGVETVTDPLKYFVSLNDRGLPVMDPLIAKSVSVSNYS